MSDGGKKDATYIMDQFWRKVNGIDVDKKLTDCFFFDGALNVQTTDAIYCATYLQAICFFVEGSMSCPCFSATSPNSNPYKLVLHFLFTIYTFSNNFAAACSEVL